MGTVYKGWNAKLFIDDLEIACAESASVDVSANLDSYYCIGKRDAFSVVPGNFEITGSITHAWVNIYYLNLLGLADITAMPPKFKIVFKASTEVGAPMVYLYNCMFEKGSLDIPTDGVLKESYDFRAESIWVGVIV
jgi:hypothetical protein